MADIDRQVTADEDRCQIHARYLSQEIRSVDVQQWRSRPTAGYSEHDDEDRDGSTPGTDTDKCRLLDEGQGKRALLSPNRCEDS